jgi:putative membrane protein
MNAFSTVTLAALLAAGATAGAPAQTQTQTSPDPSAASSPHQRDALKDGASEAPPVSGAEPSAASTPHQQQTLKGLSKADTDAAMEAGATPATFVKAAAEDGMTEVELGKLALQKSSNDAVKQFAQKMVDDHGQANKELTSLARSKGLKVPTKLDTKHESMVQALRAKSGMAFDSDYAAHMAQAHTRAVVLFEAASQSSDADLAAFAKRTLPTLQQHEQLADNLRASVRTRTASAPSKVK